MVLLKAEVNAECDTALTDYGANTVVPPSVAQFNARTLVAASYATSANQTTIAGYTDTLETSATTIAGYTDSLEAGVTALQTTANTIAGYTDTLETTLTTIQAAITNVTTIGTGAISTTITCQVGGVPLDGVEVWITTDEDGENVIAGTLVTDANGQVTFMLDAGTVYVWRQLAGYNFSNPQTKVVS